MIKVDGVTYYDSIEMSYALRCNASVVATWYSWYEKNKGDCTLTLPKPHKFKGYGNKNYFTAGEIEQIRTFKLNKHRIMKEKVK